MPAPALATPAATMAICLGGARASNWPSEACATCAWLAVCGNELGVTVSGICNGRPNPNFSAWSASAFDPSDMPRLANAVLHEIRSASARLTWLFGPHGCRSSLGSTAVDCGRSSTPGADSWESAWYLPVESAAAVSMSLNVEPGG